MEKRKEVGLRRIIAMLVALTTFVVVYDLWCLIAGRAGEGLYVLPFAPAAFIAITAKIVSHLETFDPDASPRRDYPLPKGSPLHPDNRPKAGE
jgi:hypothetical protein